MKSERMVILVTPEQKAAIASSAKALKLSAGEIVRRAVESYRPDGDEALLGALAVELERSARETRKALRDTVRQLTESRKRFRQRRGPLRSTA